MESTEIIREEAVETENELQTLNALSLYITHHCHTTQDISLSTGHAGITLFLYYYSIVQSVPVVENKAQELLVDLYKLIIQKNLNSTINQLPGIGWLFSHLENEKKDEINQDEILAGIDAVILKQINFQFNSNLSNGGALSKGSYLIERYKGTKDKIKKIQITEALTMTIDELNFNFQTLSDDNIFDQSMSARNAYEYFDQKIQNLIKLISFLEKTKEIGIYDAIVDKSLSTYLNCLSNLIKSNEKTIPFENIKYLANYMCSLEILSRHMDAEKEFLQIRVTHLVNSFKAQLSSLEYTPYVSDLIKLIICLKSFPTNIFQKEEQNRFIKEIKVLVIKSLNQQSPGYFNSAVGVANLGLNQGLSFAGLYLIGETSSVTIPWKETIWFR